MMTFKKSHILRLTHNGKLLINVVDNLIVVHYQHTKVIFLLTCGVSEYSILSYIPITYNFYCLVLFCIRHIHGSCKRTYNITLFTYLR